MNLRVLIFAGPNGSGKSTLTTEEILANFKIKAERYINADDIARQDQTSGGPRDQQESEREAFRQARARRALFRKDATSFAFETVFSHPSTLLDMKRCREAGFEVIVLFVTTENPEINVARVAGRFQAGGHDVPVDLIRSRYKRSMTLLPRIIEEAHRSVVYDNSAEQPLVFPFLSGKAQPTMDLIPKFLNEKLVVPLRERAEERAYIAENFKNLAPLDEENSEHQGSLSWVGSYYAIQDTKNGQIRHDRLLLDKEVVAGNALSVVYKDALGEVQV